MALEKFAELFAKKEIGHMIFADLTLDDICRLHGVCRLVRGAVRPLLDDRFNINRVLKDFVNNCDGFRQSLGKADALIIGGFVLDFLSTPRKKSLVLSILVEQGSLAEDLVAYLCEEEAFERQESEPVSLKNGNFKLVLTGFLRPIQVYSLDQNPRLKFA